MTPESWHLLEVVLAAAASYGGAWAAKRGTATRIGVAAATAAMTMLIADSQTSTVQSPVSNTDENLPKGG